MCLRLEKIFNMQRISIFYIYVFAYLRDFYIFLCYENLQNNGYLGKFTL